MSNRNTRRLAAKGRLLPRPPQQDLHGEILLGQISHCIDTSPAEAGTKLAAAAMFLARAILHTSLPGSEMKVCEQATNQVKILVEKRLAEIYDLPPSA